MKRHPEETPENFVRRVKYSSIMKLMSLNIGDVVKIMRDIDEGEYCDLEVDHLFVSREERYNFSRSTRLTYRGPEIPVLFRVMNVIEGIPYVEPLPVPGLEDNFYANDYDNGNLLEIVDSLIRESYIFDESYDDEDQEEYEKRANNLSMAVILDKDYEDSIIFDYDYVPYESNMVHIEKYKQDLIKYNEENKQQKKDIEELILGNDMQSAIERFIFSLGDKK